MNKRIDWNSIRNEYINGVEKDGKRVYPSQPELADKYELDKSQIGRKASAEGWLEKRQIVVSKISERCQKKTIEQISNKGVDFDLKSFTISQTEQETLKALLNDPTLKVSERCMLIKALKDLQGFAKAALGENNSEEQVKIIVERVTDDTKES